MSASISSLNQVFKEIKAKVLVEPHTYPVKNSLKPIPISDDIYIINKIIHLGDGDRLLSTLEKCYPKMADNSKLLLLERSISTSNANNNRTTSSQWLDIAIFLMTGGGDRRETKYRELLAEAGFKLTKIVYTQSSISVIEAVKI